ncbi:MAG: hypothetical protein C4534_01940 [Gaiellales bacterium]|nr:MAG: hypothetical protein C4534_01940 [Gaiellales bacterium]
MILTLALLLTALAAGCGEEEAADTRGDVGAGEEPYSVEIDPADFVAGVDNPYLPYRPGTTWIYEGETDEGTERIEVTVTGETREVMGVTCVVVRDQVRIDGELVEDTLDWFAQDRDGNVWYFGEDSKELENGEVVSAAGSWEAGVDGALPGIVMQADPVIGETYHQEYYRGEAEDMAKVLSLDETVELALGAYTGCLQTEEWTPLEPGIAEHKFYARGVGVILEEKVKGGEGRIELIEFREG